MDAELAQKKKDYFRILFFKVNNDGKQITQKKKNDFVFFFEERRHTKLKNPNQKKIIYFSLTPPPINSDVFVFFTFHFESEARI